MLNKDHWRNPRTAIATKFENNDYGYMFHAGVLYQEFLNACNLSSSELKTKSILDYGCGTGRVTRFLALASKYAVGYDPTVECIIESKIEGQKIEAVNKQPALLTSDFSKITNKFDIVVCINVLEHLHGIDYDIAIRNIIDSLNEGGMAYLWIPKTTSLPIKDIEKYKNAPGRLLIVRGQKINGAITIFENCI